MNLVLLSKNGNRKSINKPSKKENNLREDFNHVSSISMLMNKKKQELRQSFPRENNKKCDHIKVS
jgi:hypothetical protein